MAYRDLREFMSLLEKKGLLARVRTEVDPSWEINGITNKLIREKGPAVLFENIKGHKVPLVAGVFGTLERVALALGIESASDREVTEEWARRIEHPIPPRLVKTGPCKENILMGDKADIDAVFPPVLWHKNDGGPYIGTLSMVVTKDPDSGVQNSGIYRMMCRTKNETGLYIGSGQHGERHFARWRELHLGKPMPVAVATGTDPVFVLAGASKLAHPPGEDDYAGGLRKEPLELVKCETSDLAVPATSEIILEGEVYPEERKPDGPFGEYFGYQGDALMSNVFHLKAITHRNNPIFHGAREGYPSESDYTTMKAGEVEAYSVLRKINGVVDVHSPAGSIALKLIVSIRKTLPGQVNGIIHSVWGNPRLVRRFKSIIVVDDNVDVRDPDQVEWALATHVQADRNIMIASRCPGVGLDPSQPHSKRGWTAKYSIDATMPVEEYRAEGKEPPLMCDDLDIKARVEARWEKYGINV